MRFEVLKKAVIESARLDMQEGHGRGEQGIRLAEFARNSEELYALDHWVSFGWDGISPDDWDIIEDLVGRQREKRSSLDQFI
jgi:hypothetical protein